MCENVCLRCENVKCVKIHLKGVKFLDSRPIGCRCENVKCVKTFVKVDLEGVKFLESVSFLEI